MAILHIICKIYSFYGDTEYFTLGECDFYDKILYNKTFARKCENIYLYDLSLWFCIITALDVTHNLILGLAQVLKNLITE